MERFELTLPRNAYSPRETARAGDIWRLFQDAAVVGSARLGWDPARYSAEGVAFIVRSMTVVHHREVHARVPVAARTWVSTFRRGTFTDRQIRLERDDPGAAPLASATQAWVHVRTDDAGQVRPARASAELQAAFPVEEIEPDVALPDVSPVEGPPWDFAFEAWHTWMDPLGHANHPSYVDWCDEALSRRIAALGLDPVALRPVAEEVRYRSGVVAPERVTVRSRLVGVADGRAVCEHELLGGDGRACATATTVRDLVDRPGLLAARLAEP